ncbi:hypothetical protein [Delftia tsuruhatensis]|uniref:Minor tail protein n=1 Tax=Delftia tsuruhatensis TaxID=180282 RepID=A0ABM6E322_9BURK|nr:hypothetical protein [Delftia tsuruhatensis]AOV01847.1 hypothetical protein BI380_11010 [Delftia tsuruhatensis]
MTIRDGDIVLLASKVMDDVPEGGGGPSGNVIEWGVSNGVFPDVTEVDRAGGDASIRQLFSAVRTPDTEALLDANVILSGMPTDPNVSVTLVPCGAFDRRTEIAAAIASYLIPAPEWNGFLLENHVQGQAAIHIFHRPGTPAPTIGRTLVLVANEGAGNEVIQYVRVLRVETETQTFSFSVSGGYVDYQASVTRCEITPRLRTAFAGSPPSRAFAPDPSKTKIRDTTVADAATYYGAQTLSAAVSLGENVLRVSSIYTQLVPSSRTESVALDQRPAGVRQLTLATAPRDIRVAAAPHTRRIRVSQENRGYSWVNILRPFPAPNTVAVSFQILGIWYTATDNGQGELTGGAVGTVNYTNGSISVTLPELPDDSSSIIFQWGEASAFVNRTGATGWRLPEHALRLDHRGIKRGTLSIKWQSAGVLRTATDNDGQLQGDATGEINYASGALLLRPKFMVDAGGQFAIEYDYANIIEKNVVVTPDAGGFATVNFDTEPAAGSVSISWITVRNLSASSGASSAGTAAAKNTSNTSKVSYMPQVPPVAPPATTSRVPLPGNDIYAKYMAPGGTRVLTQEAVYIEVTAAYAPDGYHYPVPDATGVTWSEGDFAQGQISIGGTTYRRWGSSITNGSNGS